MKIDFFEEDHSYLLNQVPTPSITRMLGDEGITSFEFCSEQDRNRGSAVHKIASLIGSTPWQGSTPEEIVANSRWDPYSTNPVLVPYGFGLARFYLDKKFRPTLMEQPVGSERYGICGTLDQYGEAETSQGIKRWLVEFKSGRPLPGAHIQSALYSFCLKETLGLETDERVVVWLKSDGDYQAYPARPDGGVDLAVGLAAVSVWKWRTQHKRFD